jgi:hypothetical protein
VLHAVSTVNTALLHAIADILKTKKVRFEVML